MLLINTIRRVGRLGGWGGGQVVTGLAAVALRMLLITMGRVGWLGGRGVGGRLQLVVCRLVYVVYYEGYLSTLTTPGLFAPYCTESVSDQTTSALILCTGCFIMFMHQVVYKCW